jgi:hypothetical protein
MIAKGKFTLMSFYEDVDSIFLVRNGSLPCQKDNFNYQENEISQSTIPPITEIFNDVEELRLEIEGQFKISRKEAEIVTTVKKSILTCDEVLPPYSPEFDGFEQIE